MSAGSTALISPELEDELELDEELVEELELEEELELDEELDELLLDDELLLVPPPWPPQAESINPKLAKLRIFK